MTTTISSRTTANANQGLADLYGAAVKSLSARNTGLQGIDAQIKRDDARLSTLQNSAVTLRCHIWKGLHFHFPRSASPIGVHTLGISQKK